MAKKVKPSRRGKAAKGKAGKKGKGKEDAKYLPKR